MPAQSIIEWAGSRVQTSPLSALKDACLGIDAAYYLDLRLNHTSPEPLLPALGGFPYGLKAVLEDDIDTLKKSGIAPIFVFDGLDFKSKEHTASKSLSNHKAHEEGWHHYLDGDPDKVLASFTRATYSVEMLYKYLQKLLAEHQVPFMVAPYSAAAQLSYLERGTEKFIDAILGSADCFLFDTDKVITGVNAEQETFTWLTKWVCQDKLEKISDSLFRDVQLLLGSKYLPMFPVLERGNAAKKINLRDVLNLLNSAGRSVTQLCNQYRDDVAVQHLQYADRYKKAIMTIKHHVVLEANGKVQPTDIFNAPGDVHEFIGQRLPEELYFYISKGMLGPEVPNWLTSGEINLSLPAGCADSELYRKLLSEQLNPLRTASLSLLSSSLHRYYQTRPVSLKVWYDQDMSDRTINLKELPPVKAQINAWRVHLDGLPEALRDHKHEHVFLAAIKSLHDASFVQRSAGKHPNSPLRTEAEISYNVLWRFLQLRGFVNEKHELTSWGKALEAALATLDPTDKNEEGVLLAVEMLRLGLLNGNDIPGVAGGSQGDKENKTMTNLVSRTAGVGRLRHKSIGYSGPLDRQLLSFSYMISAMRASLRNLVETVLVSMFLGGEIDRDRSDWSTLALSLPFIDDNGSGLAVATQTFLDLVNKKNPPASEELRAEIRTNEGPYQYFKMVKDLSKNLDHAFKLWDAVYAASQAAAKEVKDADTFAKTNEWLSTRR